MENAVEVRTLGGIEDVYREHAAKLWRSLIAFTGSRDISSDAVAEAFAQLIARRQDVRDPARWVWRVAYRLATDELAERREQVQPASVIDHSERIDRDQDLLSALAKLPSRQRGAVVLHYLVDMPTREVASTLDITPATVRVLLLQGRRRLLELLGGQDERSS